MANEQIISKIRKLLALAGNNSNDKEAAQAMEMASRLMMQHGVEEAQVKDQPKPTLGFSQGHDNMKDFHRILAEAAADLMGCMSYWAKHTATIRFGGRPVNRQAAEELFAFMVLQVEALYKESLPKGLTQKERGQYRHTFKLAAANRVLDRAGEMVNYSYGTANTGSTALVVQHRKELFEEILEFNKNRGTAKPTKTNYKHSEAAGAGWVAGGKVEIAKGVQ